MINFLLGLLAGGLIAGIATISAARNPEVQSRLGLIPPAEVAVAAPPTRPEARCPAPANAAADALNVQADALFSRRRFWYVAPGSPVGAAPSAASQAAQQEHQHGRGDRGAEKAAQGRGEGGTRAREAAGGGGL